MCFFRPKQTKGDEREYKNEKKIHILLIAVTVVVRLLLILKCHIFVLRMNENKVYFSCLYSWIFSSIYSTTKNILLSILINASHSWLSSMWFIALPMYSIFITFWGFMSCMIMTNIHSFISSISILSSVIINWCMLDGT